MPACPVQAAWIAWELGSEHWRAIKVVSGKSHSPFLRALLLGPLALALSCAGVLGPGAPAVPVHH